MSMYYSMVLVPADPHFRPAPEQITAFLEDVLDMGVVSEEDEILLRNYHKTGVTYVGRNPRTGETIECKSPEAVFLESVKAFPKAMQGLTDFDAIIEGTATARASPLRDVGGYDEYSVSVECCQRAKLTSTSDLHEETQTTSRMAVPFGQPCELGDRVGLYSNPETVELIEVPNAGCSTFWIAFKLGKWVFPKFREKRISFVEPSVLALAEKAFGTTFVEGCWWG